MKTYITLVDMVSQDGLKRTPVGSKIQLSDTAAQRHLTKGNIAELPRIERQPSNAIQRKRVELSDSDDDANSKINEVNDGDANDNKP